MGYRALVWRSLAALSGSTDSRSDSEDFLNKMGLIDRMSAFDAIHQPNSMSEVVGARDRLVLDRLLRVQLVLRMRKNRRLHALGVKHSNQGESFPISLLEVYLSSSPPHSREQLLRSELISSRINRCTDFSRAMLEQAKH